MSSPGPFRLSDITARGRAAYVPRLCAPPRISDLSAITRLATLLQAPQSEGPAA